MKYRCKTIGILTLMSILFCFCIAGCTRAPIKGNPDPQIIEGGFHTMLDIPEDPDYSQITAHTSQSEYSVDTEYIECIVTNNNPGYGFYLYDVPYIEWKQDGEWVRLMNNSIRIIEEGGPWAFCGVEGNTTEPNSTTCILKLADITPKPEAGEYRIVVFTAKTTLYAEFVLK